MKTATSQDLYAEPWDASMALPSGFPETGREHLDPTLTWRICDGNGALWVVAGFVLLLPGQRCMAWWYPTPAAQWASPFRLSAVLRPSIRLQVAGHGWTRVEAVVQTGFRAGKILAERVGFVREGTMQRWGPEGGDYDLYRWEG